MPELLPRREPSLTRREGLAATALLGPIGLLVACSSQGATSAVSGTAPAEPAPVADAPGEVSADERRLIALYDCVIVAFPALATPLAAIREQHRQHAAALSGTDAGVADAVAAPSSRQAALRMLIAAERDAMHNRITSSVDAQDPSLARTLAFVAASEGSHVPALRGLRS